ncbi:hypothetical protein N425_06495 [Tannerella sp. oral taxon BU063 isolate Cell 2]|uniref:Uncharacterized protein n=1 Tax=Tannerella sp. oral taxon BU063 isolate Cell 2 TaxID=1411148 RepID=W2C4S0_9BACT|nr:hypothetical protein N425_06495 [Tannerella sp. oral taxon BU063 isolate Cell 2]
MYTQIVHQWLSRDLRGKTFERERSFDELSDILKDHVVNAEYIRPHTYLHTFAHRTSLIQASKEP